MTTIKIRKEIQNYIENADERMLKMVYAMLKEYENTEYSESVLTMEQQDEINKRWGSHKNGKSQSYSIQEVKQYAKEHLKK